MSFCFFFKRFAFSSFISLYSSRAFFHEVRDFGVAAAV